MSLRDLWEESLQDNLRYFAFFQVWKLKVIARRIRLEQ